MIFPLVRPIKRRQINFEQKKIRIFCDEISSRNTIIESIECMLTVK
jgi:hypothetical protein